MGAGEGSTVGSALGVAVMGTIEGSGLRAGKRNEEGTVLGTAVVGFVEGAGVGSAEGSGLVATDAVRHQTAE